MVQIVKRAGGVAPPAERGSAAGAESPTRRSAFPPRGYFAKITILSFAAAFALAASSSSVP